MLSSELVAAPQHVPICCLASALVAPPASLPGAANPQDGKTVQRHVAMFLLMLLQDSSTLVYPSLAQLLQQLQDMQPWGPHMAVHLLCVMQSLQTADDLMHLYDQISTWLLPRGAVTTMAVVEADQLSGIAQGSPLGMFLRRARLGFLQLSMQGIAELLQRIQASVAAVLTPGAVDGVQQQQQQQQQVQLSGVDVVLEVSAAEAASVAAAAGPWSAQQAGCGSSIGGQGPLGSAPAVGTAQGLQCKAQPSALKEGCCLEQYLTKLVALVERQGFALPADVVRSAVAVLRPLSDQLSKLQYLDMALALQHKDAAALQDDLHRYFDLNGVSVAGAGHLGGAKAEIIQERHHNCLLTLSSAQAALGATSEALHALREGLRQAQQHGDQRAMLQCTAGLAGVLSQTLGLNTWQQPRSQAAGPLALELRNAQEQQQLVDLLRHCLRTARHLASPHIVVYATAALARFALLHANDGSGTMSPAGGSASSPAAHGGGAALQVQQGLREVCLLQYHAAVAAAAGPGGVVYAAAAAPGGLPAAAGQLYNPSGVFPGHNSSSSSASSRHRATAAAVSEAAATLHVLQAAAWRQFGCSTLAAVHAVTAVVCYHSSAGMLVGGGAPASSSSSDRQLAYALLATLVADQQGYAAGEQVLEIAEGCGAGSVAAAAPLAAAQQHMQGALAVQQQDVEGVLAAARQLQTLADPGPCRDLQLKLLAAELQGQGLAAAGALQEAQEVLGAAFAEAAAAGLQVPGISLLTQQGEVLLAAGDPSAALPYALSAALHSRQLQLDGLLLEAQLLLARVWHALVPGGSSWVLPLLRGLLQAAKSQGVVKVEAQVQLLLAQVWLSSGCGGQELVCESGGPQQQQQQEVAGLLAAPYSAAAGVGGSRRCGDAGAGALSVQHVMQGLLQAAAQFEVVGSQQRAAEAWQLLALLCHSRGMAEARNAAAARSLKAAASGCDRPQAPQEVA